MTTQIIPAYLIDLLISIYKLDLIKVHSQLLGSGVFWAEVDRSDFTELEVGEIVVTRDNEVKKLKTKTAAGWTTHNSEEDYAGARIFPEQYKARVLQIFEIEKKLPIRE